MFSVETYGRRLMQAIDRATGGTSWHLAIAPLSFPRAIEELELAITVDLLCRQDLADTPVIVIDDASDDPEETRAPLAKLSVDYFIGQETRTGQAAARNVGARDRAHALLPVHG